MFSPDLESDDPMGLEDLVVDCDLVIITRLLELEGEEEEDEEVEDDNEAFKDTGREIEELIVRLRLLLGDGGRSLRPVVAIFFFNI
jgi:hypothetical protein